MWGAFGITSFIATAQAGWPEGVEMLKKQPGSTEPQVVLDAQSARQGKKGYQVVLVLIVSLALAGLVFIALMAWTFGSGPWPFFT